MRGVQRGCGPSSNVSATPRAPRGPRTTASTNTRRRRTSTPGEQEPRVAPASSRADHPSGGGRRTTECAVVARTPAVATYRATRAGGIQRFARLGTASAASSSSSPATRAFAADRRRPSRRPRPRACAASEPRSSPSAPVLSSPKKPPSTAAMSGSEAAGSSPTGAGPPPPTKLQVHVEPCGPLAQREHGADADQPAEERLQPALDLRARGPDGLAGDESRERPRRGRREVGDGRRPRRSANDAAGRANEPGGEHDADDQAEHQAEDQATQHSLLTGWPCTPQDVNDDRAVRPASRQAAFAAGRRAAVRHGAARPRGRSRRRPDDREL